MPPLAATGESADEVSSGGSGSSPADRANGSRPILPDLALNDGAHWSDVAIDAHVANYFECQPEWQLAERTRPHYQLWLVTDGLVTFALDRTLDRGGRAELGGRSALIIPPGVRHRAFHDPERPLRCFVIHFVGRRHGQPTNVLWPTSTTTGFAVADWKRILECAAELCHELGAPSAETALLANAAVARLLGLIRRATRVGAARFTKFGPVTSNASGLAPVLEYIGEHYASDLSLSDLCAVASLSAGHLNNRFRTTIGVAPMEYLRRHRLERAKLMLEETDLSIADVGEAVGYHDAFHFSRTFRRIEGLSPSRYRALRLSVEA